MLANTIYTPGVREKLHMLKKVVPLVPAVVLFPDSVIVYPKELLVSVGNEEYDTLYDITIYY
jgi:hypothetical protein